MRLKSAWPVRSINWGAVVPGGGVSRAATAWGPPLLRYSRRLCSAPASGCRRDRAARRWAATRQGWPLEGPDLQARRADDRPGRGSVFGHCGRACGLAMAATTHGRAPGRRRSSNTRCWACRPGSLDCGNWSGCGQNWHGSHSRARGGGRTAPTTGSGPQNGRLEGQGVRPPHCDKLSLAGRLALRPHPQSAIKQIRP